MFVVCTADAFIGCIDKVKSEQITKGDRSLIKRRKIDKVTKIDKATRG